MADLKITQLTADTSPTMDDLIVTVDNPAGTPTDKKVTLQSLATLISPQYATSGQQAGFTTTSATPVDVTGATVTIAPTRTVTVHADITGYFSLAIASTGPTVSLVIDGVTIQTISIDPNFASQPMPFAISGQASVASGSRIIKLQVTSDGNAAHGVTITNANVSVIYS